MKESQRKLLEAIDFAFEKQEIKSQWNENGYVIFEIGIKAQEEMEVLKKQPISKFQQLFKSIDENGTAQMDSKRLQMNLKNHLQDSPYIYPQFMSNVETEIQKFASIFLTNYQPTSAVCIRSYARGTEQQLHRDMTKQQYYVLQEEVHSCIVTTDPALINVIHPGKNKKEKLEIPGNSLLIFHGRLVHSGSSYTKVNTRYHCYLGGPKLQEKLKTDEFFLDTSDPYVDGDTSLDWDFTDEEWAEYINT